MPIVGRQPPSRAANRTPHKAMAQTWIAHYDFGAPIKGSAITGSLDRLLLTAFAHKIFASGAGKVWKLTAQPPGWNTMFGELTPNEHFAHLEGFFISQGYVPQTPGVGYPTNDSTQPLTFTTYANAHFQRACPSVGLCVVPGPFSIAFWNAPGEGGGLVRCYSPWMNAPVIAPGSVEPRLQLPFYDLSAPVGVGRANTPGDLTLLRALMVSLAANRASPFAGLCSTKLKTAEVPAAVEAFNKTVLELGWPIAEVRQISPTGGKTQAPSAIRALNHYYFQSFPMAYLRLSDPSAGVMGGDLQLQPTLGQALRAKLVSRFFVATQLA